MEANLHECKHEHCDGENHHSGSEPGEHGAEENGSNEQRGMDRDGPGEVNHREGERDGANVTAGDQGDAVAIALVAHLELERFCCCVSERGARGCTGAFECEEDSDEEGSGGYEEEAVSEERCGILSHLGYGHHRGIHEEELYANSEEDDHGDGERATSCILLGLGHASPPREKGEEDNRKKERRIVVRTACKQVINDNEGCRSCLWKTPCWIRRVIRADKPNAASRQSISYQKTSESTIMSRVMHWITTSSRHTAKVDSENNTSGSLAYVAMTSIGGDQTNMVHWRSEITSPLM